MRSVARQLQRPSVHRGGSQGSREFRDHIEGEQTAAEDRPGDECAASHHALSVDEVTDDLLLAGTRSRACSMPPSSKEMPNARSTGRRSADVRELPRCR